MRLLFTCCHPALAPEAQCALALRTLGGLTTREIARGFVEPESTTAQRLVRAKRKIREAGIPYEVPPLARLPERIDTVLGVLYLIFNEGYAATDDDSLLRPDLMAEAIRLARLSVELLPDDAEARGLLALMLLTDARRAARTTAAGDLVPLDDQDRSLWNRAQIDEGVRMLDDALAMRRPGPYQTQAAIAALHSTAATAGETDWRQISALYQTLLRQTPTPVVELNLAVAQGMASGLSHALDGIARVEARGELARYHLLPAAKADVLRRLGRPARGGRGLSRGAGAGHQRRRAPVPGAAAGRVRRSLSCTVCSRTDSCARWRAADIRTRPHMSDLRIDKRRVTATLTLTAGDRLIGSLFLAEQAEHHAGPERLLDVLNGPPGFLPVRGGVGAGRPADAAHQPREHRGGRDRLGPRRPGRRPRVPGGRARSPCCCSSPTATSFAACCGSSARSAATG